MLYFKNISLGKTMILLTLAFISLLFFSPYAFGDSGLGYDSNMFTVSDADVSKLRFLDIYFPQDDMSKSPLSAAIGAFNSVVLLVGGILAAYTILAGTAATAHDGEVLGKKWSSMWIPIRLAISTAFLVPSSGGFCAVQMFMLWIVEMSIGAASHVWVSYVENMGVANGVIIPNMSDEKLNKLAKSAFLSNLCVLKTNQLYKKAGKSLVLKAEMNTVEKVNIKASPAPYIGAAMIPGPAGIGAQQMMAHAYRTDPTYMGYKYFSYGNKNLEGITGPWWDIFGFTTASKTVEVDNKYYSIGREQRACGAFIIPAELSGVKDKLKNFPELSPLLTKVVDGQPEYFMALQNEMQKLAVQYMNSTGSVDLTTAFDNAILNYKTKVADRVALLFKEDNGWSAYTESVKKDGWLLAGSWSIRLIQIQEILGQLTNIYPTFVKPALAYSDLWEGPELESFMTQAGQNIAASETSTKYMTGLANMAINKNQKATENDKKVDPEEKSQSLDGLFSGINEKSQEAFSFSASVAGAAIQTGEEWTGSTNPLSIAKFYGDTAIELGNTILGVAAIVGAIMGALPFSGGWFLTVTSAASLVMPISITLWIAGNSLSVLLPLTPYMLWLGMIGGWMILVLEAMISAPLWIVTQLQPDADGVAGRGGTGYGLVLSLALRPTLMIIGLICSIELLNILGSILSVTFVSMISTSGIASGSVIKTIGILFVYFGVLYSIINRSFSLIHVIPDEVMKWLNIHGGQHLGSYAKDSVGATMGKAAMAKGAFDQASAVGNHVLQKGGKGLDSAISKKILKNSLNSSGAGPGDFSASPKDLAQKANEKFKQSGLMAKHGDNNNAQKYMNQAQALAAHIPADQFNDKLGLQPELNGYVGTAEGLGSSGKTQQQQDQDKGQGGSGDSSSKE